MKARRRSPACKPPSGAPAPLPRGFYARSPVVVARALLGKTLVRRFRGELLTGAIVEVEAYWGERDSASHAFRGRTARNAAMFGPAGHAYVYFVYGMHHCVNVVSGREGRASAVLLRALQPLAGVESMRRLRHGRRAIADGPGKLCQALAIDRGLDGCDLTRSEELWIGEGFRPARGAIVAGRRVGIDYAQPEHRAAEWRFYLRRDGFMRPGPANRSRPGGGSGAETRSLRNRGR